MKRLTITVFCIMTGASAFASNLNSDEMCQQYITGLVNNVSVAENVGMQALRVALNRIADNHPEYYDMANQVAFGTALDDEGHRRVGQHINYMCTQDGTVLNDLAYEVLLTETIRLSQESAVSSN